MLDRIIDAADVQAGDRVMEVGPGPGALTERLLQTGVPVLAVEIDRDLAASLRERNAENLEVVSGDVLRLDWSTLLMTPPYKLVANLPYNISSQILFKVLDNRDAFRSLVLMFQKEVGDRLVAEPGSREYGILSVLMQTWFDIKRVVKVPPQAFYPPPKVDSVVLKLQPLAVPAVEVRDADLYKKLVKGAFAQRRKTLRNSLVNSGWDVALLDHVLTETAIDPKRRGETLTIAEFANMTNSVQKHISGE